MKHSLCQLSYLAGSCIYFFIKRLELFYKSTLLKYREPWSDIKFLLRELDSNQRLLNLCAQRANQLPYLAHLYIEVDILYKCFGRPGRNRTHIYGFGDHYSTIELPTYCISLPCQLIWGLDGHSLWVFVSTKTPTELL